MSILTMRKHRKNAGQTTKRFVNYWKNNNSHERTCQNEC